MKCFRHPDTDAVGICKSCGRGLCALCAADLERGLACKNRCEEDVARLILTIDKSVVAFSKSDRLKRVYSLFLLAWGFLVFGYGLYVGERTNDWLNLGTIAGAIFVLFGIIIYFLPDYSKAKPRDGSRLQ